MRTYVQNICQRYSVTANDYFIALVRGEFNKQDFVETQVQFESAVTHFVNPMRALSMNISGAQLRAGVVGNIADEMGDGDEKQSHSRTFIDFLNRSIVRKARSNPAPGELSSASRPRRQTQEKDRPEGDQTGCGEGDRQEEGC